MLLHFVSKTSNWTQQETHLSWLHAFNFFNSITAHLNTKWYFCFSTWFDFFYKPVLLHFSFLSLLIAFFFFPSSSPGRSTLMVITLTSETNTSGLSKAPPTPRVNSEALIHYWSSCHLLYILNKIYWKNKIWNYVMCFVLTLHTRGSAESFLIRRM